MTTNAQRAATWAESDGSTTPTVTKRHFGIDVLVCIVLVFGPALVFLPSLLGLRVLLPIDNLLLMQPWQSMIGAVAPHFQTPHNALISDMILQNFGWKRFLSSQLLQGKLPLWNPYLLGGAPFLAAGQYQALYPLGFWFLILPVAFAYAPYTVTQLGLAEVFTYVYLRVIGEGRLGAALGGVVFGLCSSVLTSVLWPQMVGAMIWLPAILACIELTVRAVSSTGQEARGRALRIAVAVALGAVAIGLQIFAGHLEISFYVLFTCVVYSLWRLGGLVLGRLPWRSVFATALWLLALGVIGLGLAAVQLLPFTEEISRNFRANSVTLADVRGWALPLRQVVTFFIPDFYGNPTVHHYLNLFSWHWENPGTSFAGKTAWPPLTSFWGIKNYVEAASYVGIIPLLLIPLSLGLRRNRWSYFFGLMALLSLLLAFGSPLYALFFRFVPGFTQVHTAFRWVYIWSFCGAVLAGMGLNVLIEGVTSRLSMRLLQFYGLVIALAAVVGLLAAAGSFALKHKIAAVLQAHLAANAAKPVSQWFLAAQLHSGQEWFSLVWPHAAVAALFFVLGAVVVLILGFMDPQRRVRQILAVVLILLTYADLAQATGGFNSQVSPALLGLLGGDGKTVQLTADVPPSVAYLMQHQDPTQPARIASFGPQDVLAPNTAMIYGLQDVRGYDTIVLRRYATFLNLIEPQMGNLNLYSQTTKTFTNPQTLTSPLLRLLGVQYVLSTEQLKSPHLKEVVSGPINVYQLAGALPRAFVVSHGVAASSSEDALQLVSQSGFDPAKEVVLERVRGQITDSPGGGSARLLSYGAMQVIADVTTRGRGYLVLTDTYFPGWTARYRTATGGGPWQTLSVLPADETFRAVALPPGHWEVEFRYQPLSFRLGLVISLVSLAALALLLVWGAWRSLEARWHWDDTAGRRLTKNALSPMVSNLSNKVLDFAFSVFTAVVIGPDGIGRYVEAVAVFTILATVQDFGLSTATVREVARDRSLAGQYFWNTFAARSVLAGLALPVCWAFVQAGIALHTYDSASVMTLWLLVIGLFPGSLASASSATLKGLERFEIPAFVEVGGNLVRVLLGAVLLLLGWNIVGLAITSVVVNVCSAAALTIALSRSSAHLAPRFNSRFTLDVTRQSFTLMLNNLLNLVFFRIDVVLLTFLWGNAAGIGYYSIAYKFIDGCGFISSYLTGAAFPLLSRYARESFAELTALYRTLLRILVTVAMGLTALVFVFAPEIIALFYPAFHPSSFLLQLLIFFLVFSYVNGLTQYVLIALHKERYITRAFIAGVVFNVAANAVLIPHYHAEAAAIVTILSEWVLLGPFLFGARELLSWRFAIKLVAPPLVAAAGSATVTSLAHTIPLVGGLLLGSSAFLLLFVVTGGVTSAERGRLLGYFRQRRVAWESGR
ncbi:MAG: oligosaccharide flippase family protein [Chloroflexi bacterium]|nr:oligosaccharide flippase family protein [Chloroflexota bacterium]